MGDGRVPTAVDPAPDLARMAEAIPFRKLHRDGSLWVLGQTKDGQPTGYWEWFRLDGSKLRSGYFEAGQQVGAWTTYDRAGQVYKVTTIGERR